MGVLGVFGVIAFDQDDAGAKFLGFADLGAGLDVEGFGFVAGRDANSCLGEGGNYGERFAAIFGMKLLLDGGKEAI